MSRLSIMIFVLELGASTSGYAGERSFDVSAALTEASGSWGLDFTIRNQRSTAISLPLESVPWVCRNRLLVLAEQYRPRQASQALGTAAEESKAKCPRERLSIEAGGVAKGFVDLRHHIDGVAGAPHDRRVAWFWLWRPHIPDDNHDEVYGGYEILRSDSEKRVEQSKEFHSIKVDAVAMDETEPAMLGFVVQNVGQKPASIRFLDLPWLSLSGTILRAVVLEPMTPIEEIGAIRDLRGPTAWLTLPPSTYMTGEISLYKRFDDFDSLRHVQEIVVFWLYDDALTTDGAPIGTQGGFVLFRKER